MEVKNKECYGQHDYSRETCFKCSQRINCMAKKFEGKEPNDDWGDTDKPNCYGSYKSRADCGSCAYREKCSGTNKDILRGKTQKRRYVSKYKGRHHGSNTPDYNL